MISSSFSLLVFSPAETPGPQKPSPPWRWRPPSWPWWRCCPPAPSGHPRRNPPGNPKPGAERRGWNLGSEGTKVGRDIPGTTQLVGFFLIKKYSSNYIIFNIWLNSNFGDLFYHKIVSNSNITGFWKRLIWIESWSKIVIHDLSILFLARSVHKIHICISIYNYIL